MVPPSIHQPSPSRLARARKIYVDGSGFTSLDSTCDNTVQDHSGWCKGVKTAVLNETEHFLMMMMMIMIPLRRPTFDFCYVLKYQEAYLTRINQCSLQHKVQDLT